MGPSRGPQGYRLLGALLIVLALALALAAPATARSAVPRAVGPGPVTGVVVRGDRVEIATVSMQVQLVFYTDDLFRIWMAPDGAYKDPANSPPERDGAPAANVVVKHDSPGVSPLVSDRGAYYLLTTRSLVLRVYKAGPPSALCRRGA